MWLAITLLVAVWLGSLVAAYLLGYQFRLINRRITELEEVVNSKVEEVPLIVVKEPEVVSELVDPYDEVATAIYEREREFKRLNGEIEPDE